jgi:hypothetical protein
MAATQTWELAIQDTHGAWDAVGTYGSFEDAVEEAKGRHDAYRGDNGVAVFGLSDDPGAGDYDHRLELHEDGTCVHLEGGSIVGTV